MKKKKNNFKITEKEMSEFLGRSKCSEAILWFLTIPKEELSDSMLAAYKTMQEEGHNEIWLINHFEQVLMDEIRDFIYWNENFLKVKNPL
jgi:hypothetical protein